MATRVIQYLDPTYPTLNSAAAVANDSDILSIEGTWSADDSTAVTISNAVTVQTDSSSKHIGRPHSGSETTYRHRVTSGHAITIDQTKNITFDGVDIQNKSTGTSDECFRITNKADPTLTIKNCLVGFDTRNDQQDGVYFDADEAPSVILENCYFYNVYRSCVGAFQPDGGTIDINSCSFFNCGYSTSGSTRSGVVGHTLTSSNFINADMYNCVVELVTGNVMTSSASGSTFRVDRSIQNGTAWSNQTVTVTDSSTSIPFTDSAPAVSSVYCEDVTTSPYDLRLKDDSDNLAQDNHTDGSGLGLTIPSTDVVGTTRPVNTNYDVGFFEYDPPPAGGSENTYHHFVNMGVY